MSLAFILKASGLFLNHLGAQINKKDVCKELFRKAGGQSLILKSI
jgi:hypothetical protein